MTGANAPAARPETIVPVMRPAPIQPKARLALRASYKSCAMVHANMAVRFAMTSDQIAKTKYAGRTS